MNKQSSNTKEALKAISRTKTKKAQLLKRDLSPSWRVILFDLLRLLFFTFLLGSILNALYSATNQYISSENLWPYAATLIFLCYISMKSLSPAYDWFVSRNSRGKKVAKWLADKQAEQAKDIQIVYPDLASRYPHIANQIGTPYVFLSNSGDSGMVVSILGYHTITNTLEKAFFPFTSTHIYYDLLQDEAGPSINNFTLQSIWRTAAKAGFSTFEFIGLIFFLPPKLRLKIINYLTDTYFSKFYLGVCSTKQEKKCLHLEYLSTGRGISYNNRGSELEAYTLLDVSKLHTAPDMRYLDVGPELNVFNEDDLNILRHNLMALSKLPNELNKPAAEKIIYLKVNNIYRGIQACVGLLALLFSIAIISKIDLFSLDKWKSHTVEWIDLGEMLLNATAEHPLLSGLIETSDKPTTNNSQQCDSRKFGHQVTIAASSGVNIREKPDTSSKVIGTAGFNTILKAKLENIPPKNNRNHWTLVCVDGPESQVQGWLRNDLFAVSNNVRKKQNSKIGALKYLKDEMSISDSLPRVYVPDSQKCNVCNAYIFEDNFPDNLTDYCRDRGCLTKENKIHVCQQWRERANRAPKPLPATVVSILDNCNQYR